MLLLQLHQLVEQPVVFRIGDLRVVQNIVKMVVMVDLLP
jgi:hypothetical protein